MKLLRIAIIASLLVAGIAVFSPVSDASAACLNSSGNGDYDLMFGPFSMEAGSSITVTITAADGAGTAIDIWDGGDWVVESVQYVASHSVTYVFPAQADDVELYLDWQFNGMAENSYTVSSSDCGSANPIIPEQAVSGTFVETAEIYWAPGELVDPMTYIEAGKSYLVVGQDATGMYRKVLIACSWVWVRAETVGPNFDAVWNGTPLPTTVVEAGDTNACAIGDSTPITPEMDDYMEETLIESIRIDVN